MSTRIAFLLVSISGLAHGCQPLPPTGHATPTAPNASPSAEEAGAALPDNSAWSAPPKASPAPATAGDGGVIEHAVEELPPHNLRNCVPHAGETYRRTTTFKPARSASGAAPSQAIPSVHRTCSFDSECAAHRAQAPGPTDGTVSIVRWGEVHLHRDDVRSSRGAQLYVLRDGSLPRHQEPAQEALRRVS